MSYSKQDLLQRFQKYYFEFPSGGLSLDISRMNFPDDYLPSMESRMQKAFSDMAALERGAIANPDENRMVGHYWLRKPTLAPTAEIRREIEETLVAIKAFASDVHDGTIRGSEGPFKNLLLIGIGGSALGPQFVSNALGHPHSDKMRVFFFDNTDPDGMDRVLAHLALELGKTLCVVVSKSGGTKETRNGMLEAKASWEGNGSNFGSHAVAVTSTGSELDKYSREHGWLKTFPMWDWVGGRTSELLSAVGLLPAALQGLGIDGIISGASACDETTRVPIIFRNPAAMLALMFYYAGNGKGDKNLIVLPYKDRLELFSKYLQQLAMESLGKRLDLDGKEVKQGLTVLGNKGSTDQHSYIQQLRDGLDNFFVIFVEVLRDRSSRSLSVEPDITSGDYLEGFLLGTRRALHENGRQSITVTIPEVSSFTVGSLIALFERAIGLYASLININAYDQPGVEAGKKAASSVIQLQTKALQFLSSRSSSCFSAMEIAEGLGAPEEVETVFKVCRHLSANPDRGITHIPGARPFETKFQKTQ